MSDDRFKDGFGLAYPKKEGSMYLPWNPELMPLFMDLQEAAKKHGYDIKVRKSTTSTELKVNFLFKVPK